MHINDFLGEIDIVSSYIPKELCELPILSLCHNSRHATPNCIFFCKRGAQTDGHMFAYNAYSNGARIFVAEKPLNLPSDAAVIVTSSSNDALNRSSVKFYSDPSKELKIIGITGTKGKTTVAIASYRIALLYGLNAGYIGTNGIQYNGHSYDTANTTPDTLELQKALREMRNEGVSVVFLEVSSQALWQNRTYGLEFEGCVFTNLYRDHIGGYEHPTFEHYRDSKKKLFTDYKVKNIIINADSPDSVYMTEGSNCSNIITAGTNADLPSSYYASDIVKMKIGNVPGVFFKLHQRITDHNEPYDVFMPMPGHYSVENALLILAVCNILGIGLKFASHELSNVRIPGRFEAITLKTRKNSLFVIDYAHNGASLKAVIDALREYEPKRIICLFGSVGGRTFERRAELGKAARDNADILIITSDNPDNESPESVIRDIRNAVGETEKPIYMISDRGEAVKKAYELADDGDAVLLAGKGHETYQLINKTRVPFSEKRILEACDLEAMITN